MAEPNRKARKLNTPDEPQRTSVWSYEPNYDDEGYGPILDSPGTLADIMANFSPSMADRLAATLGDRAEPGASAEQLQQPTINPSQETPSNDATQTTTLTVVSPTGPKSATRSSSQNSPDSFPGLNSDELAEMFNLELDHLELPPPNAVVGSPAHSIPSTHSTEPAHLEPALVDVSGASPAPAPPLSPLIPGLLSSHSLGLGDVGSEDVPELDEAALPLSGPANRPGSAVAAISATYVRRPPAPTTSKTTRASAPVVIAAPHLTITSRYATSGGGNQPQDEIVEMVQTMVLVESAERQSPVSVGAPAESPAGQGVLPVKDINNDKLVEIAEEAGFLRDEPAVHAHALADLIISEDHTDALMQVYSAHLADIAAATEFPREAAAAPVQIASSTGPILGLPVMDAGPTPGYLGAAAARSQQTGYGLPGGSAGGLAAGGATQQFAVPITAAPTSVAGPSAPPISSLQVEDIRSILSSLNPNQVTELANWLMLFSSVPTQMCPFDLASSLIDTRYQRDATQPSGSREAFTGLMPEGHQPPAAATGAGARGCKRSSATAFPSAAAQSDPESALASGAPARRRASASGTAPAVPKAGALGKGASPGASTSGGPMLTDPSKGAGPSNVQPSADGTQPAAGGNIPMPGVAPHGAEIRTEDMALKLHTTVDQLQVLLHPRMPELLKTIVDIRKAEGNRDHKELDKVYQEAIAGLEAKRAQAAKTLDFLRAQPTPELDNIMEKYIDECRKYAVAYRWEILKMMAQRRSQQPSAVSRKPDEVQGGAAAGPSAADNGNADEPAGGARSAEIRHEFVANINDLQEKFQQQPKAVKMSREVAKVLEAKFQSRFVWPYLTHSEKDQLMDETKASIEQINTWFSNHRKREWTALFRKHNRPTPRTQKESERVLRELGFIK